MANATEPAMSPAKFSEAAAAYADHMRAHIEKENTVLFPMADRIVAPEVMHGLVSAFDRHEEEVMGSGRHEQLHDMLKELKVKYRSEEHTSELQSLMRISYAVFCLKQNTK